jgi:cysteine-S-conjugate beta-lyase
VTTINRRLFLQHAASAAFVAGAADAAPLPLQSARPAASEAARRYDFDEIYNRFGTHSTKFDMPNRVFGAGAVEIGMGVADMDFRTAPQITAALAERCQHENWGYLDGVPPSFLAAIAAYHKRRHDVHYDPAKMEVSVGLHQALMAAMRAFNPGGGKVLMLTPIYNGFYSDLRRVGLPAAESPLRVVDGRYRIDFDDFERRIGPDTHVFLLCNPHNPTGNVWSPEDLLRLGQICLRRRVAVLADEVHADFVTEGHKFTPFASLPDKAVVDNSITFNSASKSFSLAAHKIAWFYSTNDNFMARVRAQHYADRNTLGIVAHQAAYEHGEEWLNQCVAYIDGTHKRVESFIRANIPLIKHTKPEGTYLCWLDVTALADRIDAKAKAEAASRTEGRTVSPEQIVQRFLVREAKVFLLPGSEFGLGGANRMRMNIATSRKLVERALTNIARAVNAL